jgi:hypothetical protein
MVSLSSVPNNFLLQDSERYSAAGGRLLRTKVQARMRSIRRAHVLRVRVRLGPRIAPFMSARRAAGGLIRVSCNCCS